MKHKVLAEVPALVTHLADNSTASYLSIVSHPVRTRQGVGPVVAMVMADSGGMSTVMDSVVESQRPVILICGQVSERAKVSKSSSGHMTGVNAHMSHRDVGPLGMVIISDVNTAQ